MSTETHASHIYKLYIDEKGIKPKFPNHLLNFAKLKGVKLRYIDAKTIMTNPPDLESIDDEKEEKMEESNNDEIEMEKILKSIKNPHIVLIGSLLFSNVVNKMNKMKEIFSNKYGDKNISIAADEIDGHNINNNTLNSYLNDIASLIQLNKKVDSLIIIYCGYGYFDQFNNYLLCDDGEKLSLKKLRDKFTCKNCDYLSDKPKILYLDYYNHKKNSKNITKLDDFYIDCAMFNDYIGNSTFIDTICNCFIDDHEKHFSMVKKNKLNNKKKKLEINEWKLKEKDISEWTCEELQEWIKTLDISDKEYESELLFLIKDTETTVKDIEDLNDDITDIAKPSFSMYINKSQDMLNWLSAKIKLLKKKQRRNINCKHIDEWNCKELIEWIKSLNICKTDQQYLTNSIIEMECDGADINSCQSVEEISESFDEIDDSVASLVFNSMLELRASY